MAATPDAQPLWSLVPVAARARYLRRAAVAMLDELDDLALRLAEETGWPRSQLVMSELLPAARGLRALADDGPRALADRRVSARSAALLGRHARLVQSPVGVVGIRGPSASPWAAPALEAGAALLAGNAVVLAAVAPLAAQRLRAVFLRAGVPGELLARAERLECARVVDLPRPGRRGLVLVLDGAPRARVVEAALWAAFARHSAEAGRLVVAAGAARGLVEALTAGAERLRVGDPRDPATDVAAEPAVIAGLSADDLQFRDPPPGPALAVVEAPDSAAAVEIAAREAGAGPVSIWARDAPAGERVARRLAAPATWIGHHGVTETAPAVRLARHVVPRQVESRAAWAPGAPRAVAAQTALTELRYGRESRRWAALRTLIRR